MAERSENIIQLIGKEPKKQAKKVHLAIQKAFGRNGKRGDRGLSAVRK